MQFVVKNHLVSSQTARWTTALSQPSHDIDNESNDNIQVLFFFLPSVGSLHMSLVCCNEKKIGNLGGRWQAASSGINYCLWNLWNDRGWGWGGEVYKQLNDLITSYGSSTVIAAYGQNYPGKLSNFYPAEVFRLAVGGRKFAKLRRWTFSSKGQTSVSIC